MMQYLLSCLAALFSIIMLLVLTLVSPVGLPVSLLVLKATLPGTLTYTTVSGVMIDGLRFSHIRYHDSKISLSIEKLTWSWDLLSLLHRQVGLYSFSAQHAIIHVKTAPQQHVWSVNDLNWPITVHATHVHLKDIHWTQVPNTQPIVIKTLSANDVMIGQQHIDGHISVNLEKPYSINTTFAVNGMLSNYFIHWSGKTPRFKWHVEGNGTPTVLNTQLKATPLSDKTTMLNGTAALHLTQPYAGGAALVFENAASNVQVTLGYNTIWHARWNIQSSALNTFFPHAAGHFHSQGEFEGLGNTFHSQGSLSLQQFKLLLGNHHLSTKTLKGTWTLNTHAEAVNIPQQLILTGDTLAWDRYTIPAFVLKLQGPLSAHTLDVLLTLNHLTELLTPSAHTIHVTLKARGTFNPHIKTWQGTVSQCKVDKSALGTLTLQRPIALTYSPTHLQLNTPACWFATPGSFCLKGQYTAPEMWDAALQWHNLILSNLSTPHTLPLTGQATIQHTAEQMNLAISLNAATNNVFLLNIKTPGSTTSTQPISGTLHIRTQDLRAFQTLIPPVVSVEGKLNADLTLSGQLSHPLLNGHLALQSGQITIPIIKLTLTQLQTTIHASKTELVYDTKAFSGNKPLLLSGRTEWKQAIPVTTFTLRANEALLVNTPEYQIYGSPHLTLTLSDRNIILKGDLFIPTAMLKPVDISNTVTLPEETMIIGDQTRIQPKSPWALHQDVHLTLGNNVQIDAMGLKGNLHGAFQLMSIPDETPMANGSVGLTGGTFETYGKILTIEDGSHISYANSPITDPTLSIRATRIVQTNPPNDFLHLHPKSLAIGVQMDGTLDDPTFTLFSSPNGVSQADILSYLLFDQPSNANTPGNISLLIQALSQFRLGGMAPGGVSNEITQTLGLTEYGVRSQTGFDMAGLPVTGMSEQSSFVVGRYISSRIYIRYSRSLDLPINLYQMRYLFGQNWALQTESSSIGSGADILFTWAGH